MHETFEVTPAGFQLDGRPFRVLSGALHYFRVHPGQWRHRLRMLRAMGLNTVETYVPWNLHEPHRGEYHFDGLTDLAGFLDAARDEGLHAIVRPGPYICAEWDNGGLPAWLTGSLPPTRLRCADPAYLAEVDRWFDVLVPHVAARQVTRGGNVLMVQVENEYGSYGSDLTYLRHLADGLRERGVDVPLFTSDGPEDHMLTGGSVPGLLATVNFGSRPLEAFAKLAEHRPDDPEFCMEFWCGWFDHWGHDRVLRDPGDAAADLAAMLAAGASVNVYMAHGGTNFGTTAGANLANPSLDGDFRPTVTSYDYDAPIDEAGRATPKFWAFREVLSAYRNEVDGPLPDPPAPTPVQSRASVTLAQRVRLTQVIDEVGLPETVAAQPPSFEELGIAHGIVRYTATVPGPRVAYPLVVRGLADRAQVAVDGAVLGVLERDRPADLSFAVPAAGARLELLVESMGRPNYGPLVGERKGITGGVLHERQYVHGWTARALPLDGALPAVAWDRTVDTDTDTVAGSIVDGPVFRRGFVTVDGAADAWLLPGGGKGYLWLNGFLLGRYWSAGPQRALYAPAPLWQEGANELVVLELEHPAAAATLSILDTPTLT
ncbi:beta-galactosidase family protein [Hamadaea sp. NPDC051192]|uniref:glycoside hydrolase family 35 protein n=1 Tax=Hamadaea sp. NPDC051192 TaxID=3154940 RepID=UPI0034326683